MDRQIIEQIKAEIDVLDQVEMARLTRFARPGHTYFNTQCPEVVNHFQERFRKLGGMTPAISKHIGLQS